MDMNLTTENLVNSFREAVIGKYYLLPSKHFPDHLKDEVLYVEDLEFPNRVCTERDYLHLVGHLIDSDTGQSTNSVKIPIDLRYAHSHFREVPKKILDRIAQSKVHDLTHNLITSS